MAYVALIATGGTIASTRSEDGASVGVTAEMFDLGTESNLEVRRVDAILEGSYRLTFEDLSVIADVVNRSLKDSDCIGAVITHGTDTMEETAYFLDLVIATDKPIVLTGAQRTFDTPDSDGPRNLQDSLTVAASPRARNLGAVVCFAGNVWNARGVRKCHTIQSQAFTGTKVGEVYEDAFTLVALLETNETLDFDAGKFSEGNIPIITYGIGTDTVLFEAARATDPTAIVLEGCGSGNAGIGFEEAIAKTAESDIPVILATRVEEGPVIPMYGNGGGVDLVRAGAITAGTLSVFQARVLAAVAASTAKNFQAFRERFIRLRG